MNEDGRICSMVVSVQYSITDLDPTACRVCPITIHSRTFCLLYLVISIRYMKSISYPPINEPSQFSEGSVEQHLDGL